MAWRYLDTPKRRLVLIDSPGHDQYTRNMASGASHADAAVMLIDARHGLKQQTRRHAAILSLMGVPRVVLAVNKMDLVDWSEARFRDIEADFLAAVAPLGFVEARAVPVSARHGDNVTEQAANMPWHSGPSLVGHLEAVPGRFRLRLLSACQCKPFCATDRISAAWLALSAPASSMSATKSLTS